MRPLRLLVPIALLAAVPAARAADTAIANWPVCCDPSTPDYVLASTADTLTVSGDFGHPLAWRDEDFTVTSSGPRTFTFPRAGTYAFYCTIHTTTMVGRVKVGSDQHATPDFTAAPAAPRPARA